MASLLLRISFGVLVVAILPCSLLAQDSSRSSDMPRETYHPDLALEERDLAQDRFELSQASVKDLARKREQAAREQVQARRQEFLAGRGTLVILVQAELQ